MALIINTLMMMMMMMMIMIIIIIIIIIIQTVFSGSTAQSGNLASSRILSYSSQS